MSVSEDWLGAVLVHIQSNLQLNLGLGELSQRARLSPSHFQRSFRRRVGETPRQYVERLRVERGAFQLTIRDASLLSIALECGFQSQETFIRAFRRRYGQTPGEYRSGASRRTAIRRALDRSEATPASNGFVLSDTRVASLRQMNLAFIRHVGPYEDVPGSLYDELFEWARRRRIPGPLVWMGIGHDAPGTTQAAKLRFDAALVVPAAFPSGLRVSHQLLPGGEFAITTHSGAFSTLPMAYATIFERAMSLRGYRLIALPAIEIYQAVSLDTLAPFNQTDVCLPVMRK